MSPVSASLSAVQDVSSAPITYVNYFQARGNRDEVFLDLGVRAPAHAEQATETIQVTHRLALNYKTARDLSAFLNWLIEQQARAAAATQPAHASKSTSATGESPPA